METLTLKLPAIIPGDYPPRMVLADCWNGEATLLRVNREDDDIDDMIREAVHIKEKRVAANQREVDRRRRKSHNR